MSTERFTDLGNARRLVAKYGDMIRHDSARGFMVYDDSRWLRDSTGEVERAAKATVLEMYEEAAACPDEAQRKALAQWAVRCESEARLRAMIALVRSEWEIAASADIWDRDPYLLNVENGTVDVGSHGMLCPHNPDQHITKIAGTWAPDQYRPAPSCLNWLTFLDQIMNGRSSVVDFLQRAVGYSLTGSVTEQCLFFLHGLGANGKSTFLRILLYLLADYARQAEPDLLIARRGEVHPTNVASLAGTRLVVCSEVEAGRRMAESMIKQLTGGDIITARFMRGDFFQFEPTFKVWLAANHKPEIRGTDNAIWRRIRLIPFDVTIPKEQQDPELVSKLREELPGIMAWAIEGARQWQAHGLGIPAVVRAATQSYREEQDVLAAFLTECCTTGDGMKAPAKTLYASFRQWSQDNGEPVKTQKEFGMRLAERGFDRRRSGAGGTIEWHGLSLPDLLNDHGLLNGTEPSSRIDALETPHESLYRKSVQDGSVPSVRSVA
jgi:putative DNA primase/helicase